MSSNIIIMHCAYTYVMIQAKRGMGALPASRVSILMLRNVRGA